MKNLHHHLSFALAALGVWTTLAKHIHDAHLTTTLRSDLDSGKKLFGKPTPSRKAFFAFLYLLVIEHTVAIRPEFITELFFKIER